MPSFLGLGIYLILLSSDGERAGWNRFLHDGSVEDGATTTASASSPVWRHGDFYFRTTTSRRRWCRRHGIIFLWSLLRFIVVRSGHDEGLGNINFRSVFLILRWQKEKGRYQKEEVSQFRLHECWPSFVGHMFSGLLSSVYVCGHSYCKASYMLI